MKKKEDELRQRETQLEEREKRIADKEKELEAREKSLSDKEGLPVRRPFNAFNGVINTGTAIAIPSAPVCDTNSSLDDSYQTSFYESEYEKENIYFGKPNPLAKPPSGNRMYV